MNIFVGNLSFAATEADVKKLFEGFGSVVSVRIVMEKKGDKSRGFGFVQMPDEQQAQAAIAALNGKEFMGRPLNVSPARLKTEAHRESELKKKMQPKFEAKAEHYSREETEQKKVWFNPVFNRHLALKDGRVRPSGQPGKYKGGRRSRSYMKRHGLTEMQEEAKPRQRSQDNPMRWRKRGDQSRPWQKSHDEHKPWKKTEGEPRSWKKPTGEAKPWSKSSRESKPWRKSEGEWSKSSGRPQKSRFNPLTTLGTSPEFIEGRSRTKGRGKPGSYKR